MNPTAEVFMGKRILGILSVTVLAMLVFAAVASAEPKVGSSQRLRVQVDPNPSGCLTADSTAGWVVGQDAPGDENNRLFQTNVGVGGCVLLFSNASFNRHTAASAQRNLSLDITPASIALGLNYMVAEVSTDENNSTTEDTLFLDPADCNHDVNGTWHRADFTGYKGDATCTIVVNSPETATYSSDATHSAFANYAAANPGAIVIHRYVVIAKTGDSRFDRIALGAGKLYDSSNTRARNCTSEASC
jgi:hypothetical protein